MSEASQPSPSKSARRRAAKKAKTTVQSEPTKPVTASADPPFGCLKQSQLYLNVLRFDSADQELPPLGLVCATSIADAPACTLFTPERKRILCSVSSERPVSFRIDAPDQSETDANRANALKKFNTALHNILCDRRFSCPREHGAKSSQELEESITDDPLAFLLAPLVSNDLKAADCAEDFINWDLVSKPWEPIDTSHLDMLQPNIFIPTPFARRLCKESRLFRFIAPRTDLSLDDKVAQPVPMLMTKSYRGDVTYRQWFEGPDYGANLGNLPESDVLLELQAVKSPFRMTSDKAWVPKTGPANDERMTGVVPASVCRVSRMSDQHWASFMMYPSFTRLLSDRICAARARKRLGLQDNFDLQTLSHALTPTRANVGYDYERLEILGDAFLKMTTSIFLFQAYPLENEVHYAQTRTEWIENTNLRRLAKSIDLASLLLVDHYDPPFWMPSPPYGSEVQKTVYESELSDAFEALLGAAWFHGLEAALYMTERLGLKLGGTERWSKRHAILGGRESDLQLNEAQRQVQTALGYTFKHPQLLLEALTHHSYFGSVENDYERLEFLGDAILDCFVVDRLYRLHPNLPPGQITLLKGVVVCNSSLGYLAASKLRAVPAIRTHGLQEYLTTSLETLDGFKEDSYQNSVWYINPSKIIADVFEALVAAVFVDSNYELEPIFDILDNLLGPIIASLPPDFPGDPFSLFQQWMQKRGCRHVEHRPESSPKGFCFTILLHEERIGAAGHSSSDVATQLAASRALSWLSTNTEEVEKLCKCSGNA